MKNDPKQSSLSGKERRIISSKNNHYFGER